MKQFMNSTSNKRFKGLLREVIRLWFLGLLAVTLGSIPAEAEPFAYVTNSGSSGSNTVSVIDTATNTLVATVTVGLGPASVAITPDGAFAYVRNRSADVSVIDTATNTVVATVPVETVTGFDTPAGVAITPDGAFAYVTNYDSRSVSVIATASNSVVGTLNVEGFPMGVAITPDGAFAYVVSLGPVFVIDTATNTVVTTVGNGNLRAVAITPDGAFAYVADLGSGVLVIDTATNTIVATVPVPRPVNVAITPNGAFAYVSTGTGGSGLRVIDTATNSVVATIEGDSLGLAFTPDGAFAYLSTGRNVVVVFDTATLTEVARITVGEGPSWVAITPVADLAITKIASSETVEAGADITYTLTVTNNGPSAALPVMLTDGLPAETTFQSLTAPSDWSCTMPPVGESGTVTCTKSVLAAQTTATFTLVIRANSGLAEGTTISNIARVSARTFDPDRDNNMATATVTVRRVSSTFRQALTEFSDFFHVTGIGLLIQTSLGSWGGLGALRTKRSG